MKLHKAVGAAALTFLLSASAVAAQTTYPDSGSTVPSDVMTGNGTTVTSSPATAPGVPNTGTGATGTSTDTGSMPGVPNTGTTGTTGGSGTSTPGVPNTGVGGDAASTMLLLASSALAAILGGAYLYRRTRA